LTLIASCAIGNLKGRLIPIKRLIKTLLLKYLLNHDLQNPTSAFIIFARRFCYSLILLKIHVRNYRYGFYRTYDLPAIFGYVPLKMRKLISRSPGTIIIPALTYGEILTSFNLIREIKRLYPHPVVFLSRQPQVVRQIHQSGGSSYMALPYPFFFGRSIVSYWLNKFRPALVLCIENMVELRADMLELAKERYGTSVLLVNAHAFRPSTFWLEMLEEADCENKRKFRCLDMAGVVSDEAGKYLLGKGLSDSNIIRVDNLKFDAVKQIAQREGEMLRRQLGIPGDAPVLICGSVHLGEEIILLKAFQDLIRRPGLENIRLIIAPRESYDLKKMIESIKSLGFPVMLKTACSGAPHRSSTILIVDTLGELKTLYSVADVVIVAGSMLTDSLGHNPIEPAILGKAIIVGPYTPSFNDVMNKFLKRGAIIRLQKTEDLADQAAVLFDNPEIRKRMGFHAKTVVEECRGATARYLDMIDGLLPRQSVKSGSTREN